jgi:2-polyprenyl-6-methoxyphenol hydroxylase-like FAD-dependent oxidoreductase
MPSWRESALLRGELPSGAARSPTSSWGRSGRGSATPVHGGCLRDRHERILIEHLGRAGVRVERPTELLDFTEESDRVRARLERADGTEEICEAAYLAGCDGAHSRVRAVLGTAFPGGTYSHVFYVADVDASGPVMNDELHVALDDSDFVGIFPLRGGRTARLIGTVPSTQEASWEGSPGGRLSDRRAAGVHVERVNWF